VIFRHEGTIDEIMGDGILAIFGAPFLRPDDARRAVACALEMQLAMEQVDALNRAEDLPALELAIGLNTGEAVVGSIGSEKRAKYGVVGRNINLAARIESFAVGGQILVSAETLRDAGEGVEVGATHVVELKGVQHPVPLHEVVGIGGDYDLRLPDTTVALTALAHAVPVRYWRVEGKQIAGEAAAGGIVALSPLEAEIRGGESVAPLTNLRLELQGGADAVHLYGKVVRGGGGEPHFTVRFTSVPDTGRSLLESYLPPGAAVAAG
jgi:adenylate cyclase